MSKVKVTCAVCSKEELVFLSRAISYKFCSRQCMSKYFCSIKIDTNILINNWKILSNAPIRKYGRTYIKVKCTCGSEIESEIPIKHYLTKESKGCEKCSRFHTSKGFFLISGEYWAHIKSNAEKRNISFEISIEDAWEKYLEQDKKCKLSGESISFEPNTIHKKGMNNRSLRTASLDRIDSSKGYTKDNIQWLHKDINIMKNKFNEDYFIKMCKAICKNN